MRVLQLAYKMPFPHTDGGAIAVHRNTECMRLAGADVKVLAMNQARQHTEEAQIPEVYKMQTGFESCKIDTRIRLLPALLNLFQRGSYFATRFYAKPFEQKLRSLLQRESYDIIVLEHLYLCQYMKTLRSFSKAKILLRPQNTEHELWQSYTARESNPFLKLYLGWNIKKLRGYEEKISRELDGLMPLTTEDARFFKRHAPDLPVCVLPVCIVPKEKTRDKGNGPVRLYHLGSMDWRPNIQAMDWFIEKVLPLLFQQFPDLKFHLAGKKMPSKYRALKIPNLVVDGEVDDAQQYLEDKSVLIVPLLSGGGLRIKIIEAMALGKTVISSSQGARGILYMEGEDLLIANEPEEYIAQIARCMHTRGLLESIGARASATATKHYHMDSVSKKMNSFFQSLLTK